MAKIFKIWNKKVKGYAGSYSRAHHDKYTFDSEDEALNSNCHGVFHDTDTYEIHEIEQTDTVVSKLPPKKKYLEKTEISRAAEEKIKL